MAVEYLVALISTDTGGVDYVNTLAVKSDPSGPDLDEAPDNEVASGVWDWIDDEYRACLHPAYTVQRVEARGILGHDGEGVHIVGLAGTLATISSDPLPRECSAVISLKTAHVGRSGRGRFYVPSPRLAAYTTTASQWGTGGGFWPALNALGAKLLAGHDITWDGGLASAHLSARVYSRVDMQTRDVVSYVPRSDVRWLRSRSR